MSQRRESSRARAERQARAEREARRKRVIRNRLILAAVLLCLIVVVIVLIVRCGKKDEAPAPETKPAEVETTAPSVPAEQPTEAPTEAAAEIVNEKPIHIYTMNYNDMLCERTNHISRPWTDTEDLESFGAFYSDKESFPFESEAVAHNLTWESKKTDTRYQIGYELSFDVDGEHKVITILKPGDIENNPDLYNGDYPEDGDYSAITGYMGVWVYDDLHQEDNFYIHITQAEVTDDTLLTSIKLRPTPQSDAVQNLKLRAFSYSSDKEFDADGRYIGNYADEVVIDREE